MPYLALNFGTPALGDGETANSAFTKIDTMLADLFARLIQLESGNGTISLSDLLNRVSYLESGRWLQANTGVSLSGTTLTTDGLVRGLATLSGDGVLIRSGAALLAQPVLPTAMLPPQAITSVSVVASEAEMLALPVAQGAVAIRTDLQTTFILRAEPASTLGQWQILPVPPDHVLSVHGRTGVIIGQAGDYSAGQITVSPPIAGASDVQSALGALQAGLSPTAGPGIKITGNVIASDGVIFKNGPLPATASAGMAQIDHPIDRTDWVIAVQTPDGVRLVPSEGQVLALVGAWLAGASTKEVERPLIQGYTEIVQGPVPVTGAAALPAPTNGNLSILTLTGNSTVTLPTIPAIPDAPDTAITLHVLVQQDAAGGRTLSWSPPAGDRLIWDGGSPPSLSTPANSVTLFVFTRWATLNLWLGARVFKEA